MNNSWSWVWTGRVGITDKLNLFMLCKKRLTVDYRAIILGKKQKTIESCEGKFLDSHVAKKK